MRIFAKKDRGEKRDRSEKSQSRLGSSDSDEDDDDDPAAAANLEYAKPDPNFGSNAFVETDKPQTWNVIVRVIEGRDLKAGAMRVRASLEAHQKCTRVCAQDDPSWKQNLVFTLKKMSLQNLAPQSLSIKVTRVKRFSEKVKGEFCCPMGAVIHSTGRAVISKWVALASPFDDEDDDAVMENRGFLKVSIAVYSMNESPPKMSDDADADKEEIWSGAQLEEISLRVRLFRLHQLADEIHQEVETNKGKKPTKFAVEVSVGSEIAMSNAVENSMYNLDDVVMNAVSFNQDLIIPMMWPTVISKIFFRLFICKGKKKRFIGQAFIFMRSIYEPGNKGYMPTFGPSFLNFYGYEHKKKLWRWAVGKNRMTDCDGCKYLARLLVSIGVVEYAGESVQRTFIDHTSLVHSKLFENMHRYTVYCSFSACNLINPLFASDQVSFLVSMGEFGSTGTLLSRNRNSVLGALPDHDDGKYFSMPWGNHKPSTEVPGLWEDVDARLERSNAIMKVGIMLDELLKAARRVGEDKNDEVASLAVEALEHMHCMMERLLIHHRTSFTKNEKDICWENTRKMCMEKILKEIDGFKYDETEFFDNMAEKVVRFLQRMRENVLRLAKDDQISLPYVMIKMLASGRVVGYVKVPAQEIFYSENESLCGQFCGRIRALSLCWPTADDRKNRLEEFPAVVHVRMWFGRRGYDWSWNEYCQPAEMKYYCEIFAYQKKNKLTSNWKEAITYTNENRTEDMSEFRTTCPYGWRYMGNWVVRNTHDMWVCSSDGCPTFVDKVFEVQKWSDGEWHPHQFTDYFGGIIEKERMKDPGEGWKYEGKWAPDRNQNYGDKSGFVYAISEVFWGEPGIVENERRPDHKYRRRCIKRVRKAVDFHNQDFNAYQQSLGDTKWEYANGENKPFHYTEVQGDCIRRRRFMMEMERLTDLPPEREHEKYFIPRLYNVHEVTTTWQLRCYFLWAKDLLPVVKNSARAFVRVTYITKAKQTLVVEDSQNPVWNETLIFDKMLIPGGKLQISLNPPMVMVEVRGELKNGGEVFLGRFQCTPKVIIATAIDQRAKPRWNTLTFGLGRSRGSVLACFELFCQDKSTIDCLPLLPMRKSIDNRFEVPGELRPKFNNYAIQILCWGVRNLKKYQFLSVRQPFLELIIGDMDTRTDRIQNVSKEPNFPTPLITFPMVSLPAELHLSPPIVINLYDTRAFKREPLVGVCHISNLHRYTRVASRKAGGSEKSDWSKYDQLIETEDNILANTPVAPSLRREDMPELDWWSKYYASLGHPEKAPGFAESGIEYLTIFKVCLEQVGSYNGFMDFLDTFPFVKSSRGNYDDPEEKEKTGELKGKVFITKIPDKCSETVLLDPPGVEFLGTVKCLMRLYLIEATGLVSQRKNGMLDPYVIVRIGKNKVNLKKKYRPDTLDPTFGECIELEVNIPVEKDLKITIMDYRKLIPDDTIGSTRIDLENRLLTKWRATVGLSRQHTIQGEMQWRDQLTPLDALKGYCKKMLVDPPIIIERNGDVGLSILGIEFMYSSVMQELEEWDKAMERASAGSDPKDKSESAEEKEDDKESKKKWRRGDEVLAKRASIAQHGERHRNVELTPEQRLLVRKQARERIIGRPLQQVALHILLKMNLVPEHVETRTLYTEMGGSTPCGELRMFVDLFPLVYGPVPPAIDIKPRDPDKYQLRIALFNVSHAIPVKRSFGTPTSDLYVKVLINGSQKAQTSDVHFRKASEDMVEPFVIIQLWDKNKLRKDVMLGQMVMDLTNFKEGLDDPEEIGIMRRRPLKDRCNICSRRCCCVRACIFCKDTRCGCKFKKNAKIPLPIPPRYKKPKDNEVNVINLFDSDTIRGWWPVLTNDYLHRNKDDAALKKKNDDYTADNLYIMGLLELEMSIVTAEEAEADPVGKKRKEPNHSPYLPKPLRSRWNMFFITSRIRPCLCWAWHRFGAQIVCWGIVIFLLLISVYGLVVNWPVVIAFLTR
ncbi:hypothetical protein Q1695_010403 [Nippostrongylus brasiliensis]|nr:hypothetical protein Q1695_010403 [Nippostrongylus brasiliensis]